MLGTWLGFELFWGIFALLGCAMDGASLFLFKTGRKILWCTLALSGGLVTLLCSLIWILFPGLLVAGGGIMWTALFGAYVCLTGAILTSLTAVTYAFYR